MNDNSVDGFELYRRQRQRHRRMARAEEQRPLVGANNALRELEAVEEREDRDRQLQREVHDFFESARLTAAEIVQKVAETAKLQIDERLSEEMHEFLLDSLTRMRDLVHAVLNSNGDSSAEEVIEPLMHNLTGHVLDGFRQAGISAENHLGQDPMETDLEDVRREFQALIPQESSDPDKDVALQSSVVAMQPRDEGPSGDDSRVLGHAGQGLLAAADSSEEDGAGDADLERFRRALEVLVRQGSMTADEAEAALEVRQGSRE